MAIACRKEFSKISAKDAARFVQVNDQLKKLARHLQRRPKDKPDFN
jgi:hypothetical protein